MAYELTWEWNVGSTGQGTPLNEVSSVAAQKAKLLWQFARFLTGADGATTQGLWTVAGSGDSTAGGMDAVDRWALTGAFDANKIKYTSGTNYSWLCLRAPTSLHANFWLLLTVSSTGSQFGYYHCFSAPTGGGATLPTTVSPTSAVTTVTTAVHNTTPSALSAYGGKSTRGDFWFTVAVVATTYYSWGILGGALNEVIPGDPYNCFIYQSGSTNSAYEAFYGAVMSATYLYALNHKGATQNTCMAAPPLNATGYSCIPVPAYMSSANTLGALFVDSGAQPVAAIPAYLVTDTAGTNTNIQFRGRFPDFLMGRYLSWTLAPATGTVGYINVGNLWLPWPDGKTPSVG